VLEQAEPKATPKWAKAAMAAKAWNELMPRQPKVVPDKINSGVLANAITELGEDGLRDLLKWASGQPWYSGEKRTMNAQRWLAKGNLAEVAQARDNAKTTNQPQLVDDYYGRGKFLPGAE
jgi:hypothetical protein